MRDFVHVDRRGPDANVAALDAERPYDGALNVACGEPHTVLELATVLSGGTVTVRGARP